MYGHSMNYYQNALYIFGGTTGFDYFKDLYKYDLISNQWQKIILTQGSGPEPEARYKHSTVLIPDEKRLLIFGGISLSARIGNVHEFNFEKKTW